MIHYISSYARENRHNIKLAKMYKHLLEQRITCYNGQWYCYLCKITLQNLTEAQHHSENAHSAISTEVSDFLNKSIKLSNKGCKKLLIHSIVIRDVERDYFCMYCQCSVSSHNFDQHLKEKDHQECINVILKRSTNEQLDLNDNTNNNQSDISVNVENPTEHTNESNLSVEIQPICEITLVKDSSNNFTQIANEAIANVPYALIQEAKMNEHFVMQHTIRYGQWYCHLCKSMFQSLGDVECHLQEAHPDIGTQRSDFLDKSIELSDTNCRELSNHEIVMQDIPQDYFCAPCQCSLPSLHHFYEHSRGKKHKHMIKCNEKRINANIGLEDTTSKQKLNNDITANENISVNVFEGNDSIRNRTSNFRAEEERIDHEIMVHKSGMSSTKLIYNQSPAITDSISDDALQIKRYIDVAFCSLCDIFIYKTIIKSHVTDRRHMLAVSVLKIFNRQATFIIKLEKEKEIINTLQLNSKKLDGTMWPEYTETAAKYTCDKCNKVVEENDIINHETTVHKSSMMSSMRFIHDWSPAARNLNVTIDYPLFKCSFCNEVIHGILSLSIHFSKREHVENIKSLIEIKRREYDNSKNIQIYFEPVEFLSLISFENNGGAVQIKEQPVMYIKNHTTTFWTNSIRKKFIYVCFTCQCKFNDTSGIINHLCGTLKHLTQFQNIFLTYSYVHNVSKSKELNVNETHEVKSLVCTEDISTDNESLKTCNIDEIQVNAEQYHDHNLPTAVNTSSKNDTLCQNEENDSGIFISLDIIMNINNLIKDIDIVPNQSYHQVNKKSALDRYNKIYCTKFFDFEEIMFACSQRKLKEIKSNLRFFYPFGDKMICLMCNEQQLFNVQTIYEHITCAKHITQFTKLHENQLELLKELIQIQPTCDAKQYAKCYACTMDIQGMYPNVLAVCNITRYKFHTHFRLHRHNREQLLRKAEGILEEFQNLWYNIQFFACVECDTRFKTKIKFMEHLNVAHRAVLSQKDNSMFDFCLTCTTLWYQNKHHTKAIHTSYQVHCRQQTHKYLEKTNDFAVTELLQPLQKLLRDVDKTAADLFKLSNDVLNDPKITQLTEALKHVFEIHQLPVEVCMFGSRVTGLALPNSDIDIYLNFGDECTKPELIKSRSKQIQDCLRMDHDNWDIESTLDRSRTPIIKVKHRLTGLQCDISFTNGLAMENSKLIRFFNTAYPPCQKLMLFLKKWISLTGLTGPKGITNYALVWLVIFYLQVTFKIPSIAALIKSHNRSKIVSGWETGVGDTVLINIPKRPTHELLLGFFKYYGGFDYMQFVICPLLGETCRKRDFTKVSTLPNSMTLYIAQLQKENPEYFRVDSPMCVQDPFDLSHNLTKAVPILTLKHFKHYCNKSYKKLYCYIGSF